MRASARATSVFVTLMLIAARAAPAQTADDARAAFEKAKLTTRADSAEDAYLTVALNYPTSRYAAESLLRLGQARLANHDPKQAIVYLQRLMADYPRSEHRGVGAVWLARAQIATRNARAACTTVKNALTLQLDKETMALLRNEQAAACAAASSSPPPVTAPVTTSGGARYAIQVGAFRERGGARSIARQLEKAGFERVRVALMPENALYRVRVGQFESGAAAQSVVAKLKGAGYSAVLVADRQREKLVQD